MFGYLVQFGGEQFHPGADSLLEPLLLILVAACAGGLAFVLLRLANGRVRGAVQARRARRRRLRAAAGAESRARAMMSELCPHGWRAQIILFEGVAMLESGEPAPDRVALDWCELNRRGTEPAVVRRIWAPTVADALEAMVADRRTDETLEQIEMQAWADGALWPDAYLD